MQVSYLKRKPNMVAGAQGNAPEVVGRCLNILRDAHNKRRVHFFFGCFAATQLARQVQQERTQVVCSNEVARKRLAQRHSRNGSWNEWHTHTHVVE